MDGGRDILVYIDFLLFFSLPCTKKVISKRQVVYTLKIKQIWASIDRVYRVIESIEYKTYTVPIILFTI